MPSGNGKLGFERDVTFRRHGVCDYRENTNSRETMWRS